MQAVALPWTDERGLRGQYSGQVNSQNQPHGFGTFVLPDGKATTCKWWNGAAVHRRRTLTERDTIDKQTDRGRSSRERSKSRPRGLTRIPPPPPFRNARVHHYEGMRKSSVLDESHKTEKSDGTTSIRHSNIIPFTYTQNSPGQRTLYALGDTPKSPSHMTALTQSSNAVSLKVHDFAFVLRSDGQWCYSIVAATDYVGLPGSHEKYYDKGTYILFVIDSEGRTKKIKEKHWEEKIRLVNIEACKTEHTSDDCSVEELFPC
ncbi:hypothetical protein HJC23_008887 [Cyclotella cryptica]|uniref:Uncharacterized protein n=1 Tax=Cyclotella cryptica TaxID=29204 RepID=A0ABD3PBA1_9STRA|eukprot:CCRYP_015987-RA/>CCRYP_015987-RA protein AED:0.42 eAED:0.42 QI:0/-1/0/1/-1/1/1/0/260